MRSVKPSRSPGVLWIWAGLLLVFLITIRKLPYILGIPVPVRLVSQYGGVVAFLMLVWGMRAINKKPAVQLRYSHLAKVRLWQGLLPLLFAYGVLRGNPMAIAGKEFIILWFFAATWIAGANDRLWYAVDKPLTVLFYLAIPLILLCTDTVAPVTTAAGTAEADYQLIGVRHTNTLAYEFRPLIGAGIFLGVWGAVRPGRGHWRMLQIGAFLCAFVIQAGVFKFRSSAIYFALAGSSVLLLRPFLEYRRRPGLTVFFIASSLLVAGVFFASNASSVLLYRFFGADQESMFASRIAELQSYMSSMGLEVLVGRGLGGHYEAVAAIGTESAATWQTVHFGMFVFTLKGGLPMLVLFLAMLAPGFFPRPKIWYQNPCNLTAALLFPMLVLQFTLVPFELTPLAMMTYLPSMMVLARFGRPVAHG